MIRHIAILTFVDGVGANEVEAIDSALATLPDLIPEIAQYDFGPDLGITKGTADYVIMADFSSPADYEIYANHPDHVAVLRDFTGPVTATVTRVQVDIGD